MDAEWAADDCVLLLWTTDPLLEKAFDVIRAWGFTYKTVGFYWTKLNKGNGRLVFDKRSFFYGPRVLDAGESGALLTGNTRQAEAPLR